MTTMRLNTHSPKISTVVESMYIGTDYLRGKIRGCIDMLLDDPRSYYILLPAIIGSGIYLGTGDWGFGLRTSIILGLSIAGGVIYSSEQDTREK